jgi:phosphopantothenoylcysteine decarboxylase/phosphopantothenate--cysteine ligase
MKKSKKVLIGVTGGISAYKAASVVSRLTNVGHNVKVIMTEAAQRFITPATFSALSHNPVYRDDNFFSSDGPVVHIDLVDWADFFAVVPATYNTIGKVINAQADNLLTNCIAAWRKTPLVFFPAMNTNMWENLLEKIKDNKTVSILEERNLQHADRWDFFVNPYWVNKYILMEPAVGMLACGVEGRGKIQPTRIMCKFLEGMIKRWP